MATLRDKRVLLVGAGGLGCPAGRILAQAGVGQITIADDDRVESSNLHRQILYGPRDIGRPKAALAARRLTEEAASAGHTIVAVAREIRVRPEQAMRLAAEHDLVLEGTDNFASKFLVADACALAGVPVVQAGAVRWVGWALGSIPKQSACLRCVFEEVPQGRQDTCATVGAVGPVVGVLGALQAAIALKLLLGDTTAAGVLWSYEALSGAIRRSSIPSQPGCVLCGGGITEALFRSGSQAECIH